MVLTTQSLYGPAVEVREPEYRTIKVRVLRAFYVRGKLAPAGTELELPEPDARSLVAINRVEYVR